MPWNRTLTKVDESKRRQPAQILGRGGQVIGPLKLGRGGRVIGPLKLGRSGQDIGPLKPEARLLGFPSSLNRLLLLGFTGLIGCAGLLVSGCATKPFNVRPRHVAPPADFTARVAAGSVEVQAAAIRDEDYLQATFDANLIMAGILPVKLALQNSGSGPIDLKGMRFSLSAGGQQRKPIEPKDAFKRLIGYYKIRVYSIDGYKASRGEFASYGFDRRAPLAPGESRWGILFFENPQVQPPGSSLVLSVRGIGASELKLKVN